MFLIRYNPWAKTKRDQLQSWNILIFGPQKANVDEHIDVINTLGDMLGQTDELKMEKFVDTMKCDPPVAALPNLTKGSAVHGLYLHIAHSNDKDETYSSTL